MAKVINVLYGFKSEKIEKSITKELILRGYEVKSNMRATKDLIREFVKTHKELNVVILKEYLDGGEVYSPKELTELVDDNFVNVVIVVATSHRGKPEMKELYASGLYNVFFSDGKFGANPDKLADLAVKSRTRRQAREYYRIDEVIPDHINLTYEQFRDNYKYLLDNSQGANIIDRFVTISHMLYPGQLGAFIDDLPDRVKQVLMKYSEFYDIANKVYRLGYSKQKYAIPKKGIEKGLTKEVMHKKLREELSAEEKDDEVVLTSVQTISSPPNEEDSGYMEEPEEYEDDKEEVVTRKSTGAEKAADKTHKGIFGRKKAKDEPKSLFDEIEDGGAGEGEYDGLEAMRRAEAMAAQKQKAMQERPPVNVDTGGATADLSAKFETAMSQQAQYESPSNVEEMPIIEENVPVQDVPMAQNTGENVQGGTDTDIDYSQLSVDDLMNLLGK